ncbi:phage tail length tape measure family protein [Rhizobium rhizophilum]|uniref:Bacteriophage tail tape measure N-terminal domain-containing protein n=1 Tax=Rhizobium rhizophilum TaxID=1850373 RepID=A0ABY2QTS4_9HYPH|nr:phage tail length tape measure family protein [Rhizobium rhizophilum]THV13728.1 hypothetical protein E9677_12520 [Rhizobium rhizophilum]
MATDNEQLVLSISADVRQIQRQLKGLVGQTQRDTKAIEQAFGGIDKAAGIAFDGVAANSNRAFNTAANSGRRYQEAMKASTVQTGNLAAQLNDIGVQLAGGQSPFLIALQQGSQINQALGSVGARGAVAALGGAFTSLLNPVSLATIAIIALGGSAIQYFTSLLSESDKSAEALKKQGQLIQQIARDWGDAVPALREYADELERTQKLSELRQGIEIINAGTLESTRAEIASVGVEMSDLISQLQAAGEETDVILGLQSAFNDFAAAAEDGSLSVEDVQRVQDALAAAINSTGIPALDAFRAMFDQLSASALAAAGSVQQLNAASGAATTALYPTRGAYGGVDRSAEGNIQNPGFMTPENGPTPESRPLIELTGLPKARGGGGRSKAISDAEREKKAVADLIEQLEFEQSILGATDVEREVANALRRAGSAATDEQRAKIEQLVEATYAERDALKANKDAMQELQGVAKDVLGGIISDLRAGKGGADILANALDRILSKAIDGGLDKLISSIFSGAGGGRSGGLLGGFIIPGILHSGGVAGKDGYGHGRAVSPSVFSGAKRYHSGGVAGLAPGEVPAILQRGEVVIPRGGRMSGSAETITVNLAADRSVIAETADQQIQTASGTIVQVAVQQSTQRVVPTMARYQNDKAGAEWR